MAERYRSKLAAALPEPTSSDTAYNIALGYLRRGWQPVPVPDRQKGPTRKDWQNLQITEANIGDVFNRAGNVGVLLGGTSGGLTDVDLDCPEALALADAFLPQTSAIFGRKSKLRSHWLYVTNLYTSETKAAIRYVEPPGLAHDPPKSATLVELRIGGGEKGAQTIFPGSTHPSGERVEWGVEGEPASEDGANLLRTVGALAAAALLVRHYPSPGKRHEAALVLGGLLARVPDIEAGEIKRFVTTIARVANDEEATERGDSAAGALAMLARSEPTPGLPRMREVWGAELADTVAKWLNVTQEVDGNVIDTLARLSLLEYDQRRVVEAKKLGLLSIGVQI